MREEARKAVRRPLSFKQVMVLSQAERQQWHREVVTYFESVQIQEERRSESQRWSWDSKQGVSGTASPGAAAKPFSEE